MKTTLQNFTFFILLSLCIIPLSIAQSWEYVGTPGFVYLSHPSSISMVFNSSNEPYVAFRGGNGDDYDHIGVKKFDGTSWVDVGQPNFSAGMVSHISLAFSNTDEPYVSFTDHGNDFKATVMKFDGTNWVNVGIPGFSTSGTQFTSLAFSDSNELYIAFADATFSEKATVMKFNGTDWVYVGSPGFSAGKADFISFKFSNNHVLHISYGDFGNSEKATVMKFDGTNWVDVGTPGFSTGKAWNTSLAFSSNNEPYIAFYDYIDRSSVKKFNGTNWVNVGAPNYSGDGYGQDYISLAINSNDEPYVAYSDGSYFYWGTVKKFNGSSWETVGSQGFSNEQIYYTSLAFSSNNEPYVAYADAGNGYKLSVMKFTNTMSIQDSEVSRVSLYPNPANDLVTLADLPYGETHIKVFDITGKEMFSTNSNTAIETIDTANLANGVYLVSIVNNGNLAHKKLVVNK